jgi:hypothetical protein
MCFIFLLVFFIFKNINEKEKINNVEPVKNTKEKEKINNVEPVKNTILFPKSILKKNVPKFIPSITFNGKKDGYIFKKGKYGNGYYIDHINRHIKFNF